MFQVTGFQPNAFQEVGNRVVTSIAEAYAAGARRRAKRVIEQWEDLEEAQRLLDEELAKAKKKARQQVRKAVKAGATTYTPPQIEYVDNSQINRLIVETNQLLQAIYTRELEKALHARYLRMLEDDDEAMIVLLH